MGGPNDNIPATRPSKVQGVLKTVQAVHNRKPLSTIDKNIIGVPPHPSALHKRGVLAEKNAACNKNVGVPTRRPITRKFAAQLAGKDHLQPLEEVKSSAQPIISTTPSSDCTIINAEDYKPTDGQDVPMFVQHTEAMLEEIDHMDAEVEMEDLESDELVMDIDSPDRTNPLAVTEYIDDIYAFYKKTESLSCVPPNYMEQQFDINERMRAILVDWLVEVHYKFELMDETLYLTVNLIDRFLAVHSVVRKQLQLVGITAMLLACKYEEVSVPIVDDFIAITDKAYCREEVLHMEKLMVNTLQFNLSVPTPYVFMRRFLKAAQCDNMMEKLSFFIVELSLIEYETLRFPPSLVAAAAIFTANCSLSGTKQWSKTCETCSSYSVDQLLECARMMVAFHEKAGDGKLTGVYKKYRTSKYGYAANTVPAVFLVDGS